MYGPRCQGPKWKFRLREALLRHPSALAEVKTFGERFRQAVALLEASYRMAGARGYWQKKLELLLDRAKREYVQSTFIAKTYARLADKERALEWSEKAYADRDSDLGYLRVEAVYDPLRSDPRFQDLLRRLNFPP